MLADASPSRETTCAHTIFQQPWWLDAVAPTWEQVTVERNDRVVARLPYVVRGPRGVRLVSQPPLTPTLGPWIEPHSGAGQQAPKGQAPKHATELGRQTHLLIALADQLPAGHSFHQSFAPEVFNGLPFYWAGYNLSVRYTYRLEGTDSEQDLWEGVHRETRRLIRKAQKALTVRNDLGIDRLYHVWSKTFERQGLATPEPQSLLERIDAACAPRGARQILFAVDEHDEVHAVSYSVSDANGAYLLVAGADPALRASGAQYLLRWEEIRRYAPTTKFLDFAGSMLKPIEAVNRAFGARQTPYLVVHHTRPLRRAGAALKRVRRSLIRRRQQRCPSTRA